MTEQQFEEGQAVQFMYEPDVPGEQGTVIWQEGPKVLVRWDAGFEEAAEAADLRVVA
jgi:hypothetical protein